MSERSDDVDVPILLDVEKLREDCNPFDAWGLGEITAEEVRDCMASGDLLEKPYDENLAKFTREDHIRRIAYLATHGWSDAIWGEFSIPVLGYYSQWLVADGNHRFAAAIVRGDRTILASCQGQQSEINRYLPDNLV